MRTNTLVATVLAIFCVSTTLMAQKTEKANVKFGKVSPEDFAKTSYSIDTSAGAVVIADIGSTEIVGNTKGWFSLEYRHYKRVHILKKNGYDISNVSIPLYKDGDREEQLENLKAITYNLVNGKVVETKLDVKNGVFKDELSKKRVIKKFTFPDVKEGSIIEYEYRVNSDFLFNLQPWEFQGAYPRLWSEYKVRIPQFLGYVFLMQGYHMPYIRDQENGNENYIVTVSNGASASERHSFTTGVTTHRWVLKDIPVLKEESYTSAIDNHVSKIEFQLSEYKEPLTYKNVMGTWPQLANDLLQSEYFGSALRKENNFLGDVIDPLIAGKTSAEDKARAIFRYVQKNFTCTNHNGVYMDQSFRNMLKSKKGTVSEINLLLVAMLRYAKIQADPVILSTRSHGYTYALYPMLDRFNYLVCQVMTDNKVQYLDASLDKIGYGKLSTECYNGHARVIDQEATAIDFLPDSLTERKVTSVFIVNDEKGHLTGSFNQQPGYFESYSMRRRVGDKGEGQLFADFKKQFASEITMKEPGIDSLEKYDEPITVHYKFDFPNENEDVIYFNPMLSEAWTENPFKSAERFYPVEMPYGVDETFLLRMDIPAGYAIDELPKQMVVKMNEEEDAVFEYRISENGGVVSLRSRLRVRRAYFEPEEYEMLREFFNLVVKKHAEQIVFKKKK